MATIEYDGSYLNTAPGKIKVAVLLLSIIGIIVLKATGASNYARGNYFVYIASSAILCTGLCLILLLCLPNLRQNRIFLIIELIIVVIFTISFAVATWDVFTGVWKLVNDSGARNLLVVIAYIVAVICGVFAVINYAYDVKLKWNEFSNGNSL